jgi:hypothetical protein
MLHRWPVEMLVRQTPIGMRTRMIVVRPGVWSSQSPEKLSVVGDDANIGSGDEQVDFPVLAGGTGDLQRLGRLRQLDLAPADNRG